MHANRPNETPPLNWRSWFASIAAFSVSLAIIIGVRSLTSDRLGGAVATLAGVVCASVVVYGGYLAAGRLSDRQD
jgi:hypothetical protein